MIVFVEIEEVFRNLGCYSYFFSVLCEENTGLNDECYGATSHQLFALCSSDVHSLNSVSPSILAGWINGAPSWYTYRWIVNCCLLQSLLLRRLSKAPRLKVTFHLESMLTPIHSAVNLFSFSSDLSTILKIYCN